MNFRPRSREEPEINLIPFIDVLLVVLIFLMLTTTYNKYSELQLQLPTANAAPAPTRSREIVVAVASDGRYAVDRRLLAERGVEAVADALRDAAQGSTDSVVVVSADASAAHQAVITVLEAARRSGLTHLTFATQGAAAADRR